MIDGEENEATALQHVADDHLLMPGGKSYTLFGTEAGEGYRGLMIRSGRKQLVRE